MIDQPTPRFCGQCGAMVTPDGRHAKPAPPAPPRFVVTEVHHRIILYDRQAGRILEIPREQFVLASRNHCGDVNELILQPGRA